MNIIIQSTSSNDSHKLTKNASCEYIAKKKRGISYFEPNINHHFYCVLRLDIVIKVNKKKRGDSSHCLSMPTININVLKKKKTSTLTTTSMMLMLVGLVEKVCVFIIGQLVGPPDDNVHEYIY